MKKNKRSSSHQRKDDSWKKYTKKYEPIVRTSGSRGQKRKAKSGFGRILDYALLYGLPLFIYLCMLAGFLGLLVGGVYLFFMGEGENRLGGVLCFAVAAVVLWALWQCFGLFGFIMDDMMRSESYYEEHSGYILEDLKRMLRGKKKSKKSEKKVSGDRKESETRR